MTDKKKYHRLPGRKRKTFGKNTLWLGPDHLLLIESTGMSETYRRFYYPDIKSLIVARTRGAFYKTLVLFSLFLTFLLLGFYFWTNGQSPALVFFWIMAPIFLIYCLINLIGGPSCNCWIITAVGSEKLSPANRLRPTLTMMNRLKARIDTVQGTLDRSSLLCLFDEKNKAGQTLAAIRPETPPLCDEQGRWHTALFVMLCLMSLLSVTVLYYRPYPLFILGTLLFFGISIAAIIALVRQKDSRLPKPIKHLTWAGLGLVIMGFVVGYGETLFLFIRKAGEGSRPLDQIALFKMHAQLNPFDYPLILVLDLIGIGAFALVGLGGLILINRWRRI